MKKLIILDLNRNYVLQRDNCNYLNINRGLIKFHNAVKIEFNVNNNPKTFKEFIKSIKRNRNKKIGIMFGPEASGLSNEDITYSNYIFKIPVSKNFESINLSHSLIIVCFEIFKALKPGYLTRNKKLKDITSKRKFNTFFDFLETRLDKKGFFVPREKKKAMLINLRNIFGRIELSNKELRILSSVFSKL